MASSKTVYLKTKSVDDIHIGDLIELSRAGGLYAHWVVYVGHGNVIHLSPPPSNAPAISELCSAIESSRFLSASSGTVFAAIKVRKDRLTVVAAGSAIVVNNECDDEMRPYPGAEIVQRAESKLGTNDYNPLTWNCEHFATWCRYGKAVSKQVNNVLGSLSKDAYLVALPGLAAFPPGTLPANVVAV